VLYRARGAEIPAKVAKTWDSASQTRRGALPINVPAGYPFTFLSAHEWSEPFRFNRIEEVLRSGKDFAVADSVRLSRGRIEQATELKMTLYPRAGRHQFLRVGRWAAGGRRPRPETYGWISTD
jgi:hypothetical protein